MEASILFFLSIFLLVQSLTAFTLSNLNKLKCRDIDLLLTVVSSDMNVDDLKLMRNTLMLLINELQEMPSLKRSHTRLAVSLYSNVNYYLHGPVSITDKEYTENLIRVSIPIMHGKFDLVTSLTQGDISNWFQPNSYKAIIIVANSVEEILGNQPWYFERFLAGTLKNFMKNNVDIYLIRLNATADFPKYLSSEPGCAFRINAECSSNIVNMAETIEQRACHDRVDSRNCFFENIKSSCSFGAKDGYLFCDSRINSELRNNVSFPYEIREYDQKMLADVTTVFIINFNFTELPGDVLPLFTNRKKCVTLTGNRIKYVKRGNFYKFKNVYELILENNMIESIDVGSFETNAELKSISLATNKLEKISKGTFSGLVNLNSLDLSDNVITAVDDYTFKMMSDLDSLSLTNNRLTAIYNRTFFSLKSLRSLMLNLNKIVNIEDGAFSYLENLSYLNLENNQIRSISMHIFRSTPSLSWLIMSANKISVIDSNAFQTNTDLQWVKFADNYLDLENIPITGGKNYIHLNLMRQNGKLNSLNSDFFTRKLKKTSDQFDLVIAGNDIDFIAEDTFRSPSFFKSLKKLSWKTSTALIANIIRMDVCNLKFFALDDIQQGMTLFYPTDALFMPKTDENLQFILENCEARLLMAKYNIIMPYLRYPPFGAHCFNYVQYRKDC